MARIRTIKPEFWEDETLSTLPIQARLLFVGTWNFADDFGVILNSPKYLKAKIFPYDESLRENEFNKWLDALVNARMLVPFTFESKSYLYIRTFNSHQLIDKRYTKSILPEHTSASEILAGLDLQKNATLTHCEHVVVTRSNSKVIVKEEYKEEEVYRKFSHLKISVLDFNKLIDSGFTKSEIDNTLDKIENYKKNTNYKSLYLTSKNWLEKDKEKSSVKKESGLKTVIDSRNEAHERIIAKHAANEQRDNSTG